jgi:DNA-binding PadR family transcriptional regulator
VNQRDIAQNNEEPTHTMNLHEHRMRGRHTRLGHGGRRLRGLFHGGPGGSVRRGNVRFAILAVLADKAMHGYQVIQELETRTAGRWRPSAGSIYPTLQQLEDEGLVTSEEIEGRRTYSLTDAGRKAAEDTPLSRDPWLGADAPGETQDLRRLAMNLIGAAVQVKRAGSPQAIDAARAILIDSKKRLYRLLADDTDGDTSS